MTGKIGWIKTNAFLDKFCLKSAVMYSSFIQKKLLPDFRDHESETTSDWSGFQHYWYIPPVPKEVKAFEIDCDDDSGLSTGSEIGKEEMQIEKGDT